MNGYRSPSPKRSLLPSSTPAANRFKNSVSPQRDHSNNGSQGGDKFPTHLHEFSPIVGTFLSSSSAAHRSKERDSSVASSFANSLEHRELSTTELLDKLSKDPSAFAAYLRDSLVYSEQLRASAIQTSDPLSNALQGTSTDATSSKSTIIERIYGSLAQSIKLDVSMLLEYKELHPELLKAQAKNVFFDEVDENYEVDTQLLLHPLLNSDRITSSYASISEISRTKFACIYKARHRITGMLHCLKRSLSESADHCLFVQEIMNEASALALLKHKNIVRYFDSWCESETVILATEYCLGGSLFDYLHPFRPYASVLSNHDSFVNGSMSDLQTTRSLTEIALFHLLQQMCSALDYLHTSFRVVHGDIKPSNILIQLPHDEAHKAYFSDELATAASAKCVDILQSAAPYGIVFKLSDFGRSSLVDNTREREGLGDGRYLPSLEDPSDPKCVAFGRDIYALGVTLYHAAGGDMTFSVLERFRDGEFTPDDALVLPHALRPIFMSMLKRYAVDRPTASDLLAGLPFCGNN